MKILHVTKKYPDALGGDAIVVANLEKQQQLAGNEVIILTSNCKEIKKNKNVFTYGLLDTPSSLDAITIKRLFSLVRLFFLSFSFLEKNKPDVIHTHSIDMAFFISFAARLYQIPIVHTFHSVTFNESQQHFLRRNTELFFLKHTKPKKIIVLNPADIKDFKKKGFTNIVFIPNGIILEDWMQGKTKKNKIFTFISVGRLEEQKGFTYLLKAATIVKKENKQFCIQIVGDGSQYPTLLKLIVENKLEDTVSLLGSKNTKELRDLYGEADAFILPSLWEEFPITLLEAWASKLPAIVTDIGAIPEICKNETNALIIHPAKEKEIAYAMEKLINNKTLANKLATNGYEEVIKKYQWKIIAGAVTKTYGE